MANQLQFEVTVSDFPPGVQMTPAQFAQWLVENMSFIATGEFLTGQVGGAKPTADVGLYLNGRRLEVWDGAAYGSLLQPPIGAMFPYPSLSVVPPEDYLYCEGQLILKTDFPLLRDVINDGFKATGDDPAYFRLPSTAGRVVVGAGTGDYNPAKASGVTGGAMIPRTLGDYFGFEWPNWKQKTQVGAPTGRYIYDPRGSKVNNGTLYTSCVQPSLALRWLIRAK